MVGKNEGISSQVNDLKKFGGELVAERVALGGLVGQVRGRKVKSGVDEKTNPRM